MDTGWQHTTVLLNEAVDALLADASTKPEPTYVDATFGRGGHSRLILERLPATGRLIAFDKDPEAIAAAGRIADARFTIRHQGFRALGELPRATVAGVLLDLGVSSPQIDNPDRGFSFRSTGPLDMRMDPTRGQSAADWLATARHPLTKRPYTEMVYQPMLEVLTYLRTNGFKTFIVSAPCAVSSQSPVDRTSLSRQSTPVRIDSFTDISSANSHRC